MALFRGKKIDKQRTKIPHQCVHFIARRCCWINPSKYLRLRWLRASINWSNNLSLLLDNVYENHFQLLSFMFRLEIHATNGLGMHIMRFSLAAGQNISIIILHPMKIIMIILLKWKMLEVNVIQHLTHSFVVTYYFFDLAKVHTNWLYCRKYK